jgi:CAAX prenyl protease-like protein
MSATIFFTLPFIVFMALLAALDTIAGLGRSEFAFAHSQYWIFPLQTVVCGAILAFGWRRYKLRLPKQWLFSIAIAILVLAIWLSPQELFGFPRRFDGFNPTVFPAGSAIYWATVLLRFLRLVVVVPLLEEIFWRGFLLRALINEDFESLPIGAFSWRSFGGVTVCFALAHWGSHWYCGPDFWPAVAAGALYNVVAIRTRSLSSCVLAHAVTNLLLGVYIMTTHQWGFW